MSRFKDVFLKFAQFLLLGIINYTLFNLINFITYYFDMHYLLSAFLSYGTVVFVASLSNVLVIFRRENHYKSIIKPVLLIMLVYISALLIELILISILFGKYHLKHQFIIKQIIYFLGGLYCFLLNMLFVFRKKKIN